MSNSKPSLTAEEIQAKLEKVADFDEATIKAMKSKELRDYASGLNIPKYWDARKSDLADSLINITAKLRLAKRLELERQVELLRTQQTVEAKEQRKELRESTQPDGVKARAEKVFNRLVSLVNGLDDLEFIKEQIDEMVVSQMVIENTCYADTTNKSNKTEFKKHLYHLLENKKEHRIYEDLSGFVDRFCQKFDRQMFDQNRIISKVYKADIAVKNSSLIPVNGTALVNRSMEVLTSIRNAERRFGWQDVSIALAIATGRRAVEIHCQGHFEKISEDRLQFTGQAKARHNENVKLTAFEIPCLVNADLVLGGIAYLDKEGKRFAEPSDGNTKPINQAVATPLKRRMIEWGRIAGIESLTYKNCRDIYAEICTLLHKPKNQSQPAYIASILGHKEDDIVTALSYQKFTIADWD